jgi:phenylalanyl-tRNA synthetase beta chain
VAKIFHKDENEETGISESSTVAGLISGSVAYGPLWKKQEVQPDFYYLKGVVETLIQKMTSVKVNYESISDHKLFHPKKSAVIKLGLKEVGILGEVHPLIRESILGTEEPVLMFELNLELLKRYIKNTIRYKSPSEFPGIELDLALVVEKNISNYNLLEGIKYAGGPLLASVNVFDVYEGSNIPENKKSMAFRLYFSSNEKTLEDKDVKPIQENILKILSEKFSAQLRA